MTRLQKIRSILDTFDGGPYVVYYYDDAIDDIPQKIFDDFLFEDFSSSYHFKIKNKKMIIEIDNVYFDDRIEIDMRLMSYDDYLLKYDKEEDDF